MTRPPSTRTGPRPGLLTPTGARPRLDGRHVGLVSDSMLLGGAGDILARRLAEAGAWVTHRDARGGLALFQHPGMIEALASPDPDPEVIIGVFGYNDVAGLWVSPGSRATVYGAFDRAVATAEATGTCWVWPTIGTDFVTYTSLPSTWPRDLAEAGRLALELDDHMVAAAARSRFLRVVDWQPMIDGHRSTWTGDGLHLSTAGARQFADVLVEAAATCPPLSEERALARAAEPRPAAVGGQPS